MRTAARAMSSVVISTVINLMILTMMWIVLIFLLCVFVIEQGHNPMPTVGPTLELILGIAAISLPAFATGFLVSRVRDFYQPRFTSAVGVALLWAVWAMLAVFDGGDSVIWEMIAWPILAGLMAAAGVAVGKRNRAMPELAPAA